MHSTSGQRHFVACTISALTLIATLVAGCADEQPASRRGTFAFHYSPSLSDEQLAWYARFEILVTHDPLPPDQIRKLRAAGTRLVLYEWSIAFYETRASAWQRSLLANRKRLLLNEQPLTGGVGSETAPAWYFDPATAEHRRGRAVELARAITAIGYDGIFLDTTTIESLHPLARAEFQRRYPNDSYDAAFAGFLAELRKELGDRLIFTNQGYRAAEHYLPWADWDLTESLITRPAGDGHGLRALQNDDDPWNSSLFIMRRIIEPVAARYPAVRFAHLNYVSGFAPDTIRLVLAIAQLFGHHGYVAGPSMLAEMDSLYFDDPGRPLSRRIDSTDGHSAHRFFEHALIAVTESRTPVTIDIGSRSYRNRFTGEWHCGPSIEISSPDGMPRAWFFDRAECGSRP